MLAAAKAKKTPPGQAGLRFSSTRLRRRGDGRQASAGEARSDEPEQSEFPGSVHWTFI
jgi:hypothetical protein